MSTISEAEYERRIAALEKLNATLAAEIDRQRPVVQAAVEWRQYGYERKAEFTVGISPLLKAIDIYDVGKPRPCEEMTAYKSSGGKDGTDSDNQKGNK